MTDPHPTDSFRELVTRGLIAPAPAPQLLARGNVDRADATRQSWLVPLPSGERAKLTLGRDLATLASRHAALSQACPAISTRQLHYGRLPAGDALLETFFDGTALESAAASQTLPPALIRPAVTGICAALAATEEASSESARVAEWKDWTEHLLALPVWQPPEVRTLQDLLLPALYLRLASGPPSTRWSNGDFLPANILLNTRGEARLIDAEFARRTHFFAEDAVRFQVLSPVVQDRPDLFAGLVPERDLGWHLYFWLRQFQLEVEHNSPAYLARVQPARLALIRRLAESVLGEPLPGWSTAALAVAHQVEDIRWLPDASRIVLITGWCHPPVTTWLRAVVALGPTGRLASAEPAARPDVQQHFQGEPRALLSGFALGLSPGPADFPLTLCAVIDHGTLVPLCKLAANDLPQGALDWRDYPAWAAQFDPDPVQPVSPHEGSGPLLSVLLPVYRTPETHLRACVDSVRAQHYPNWELCLVDDGSGIPALTALLGQLAGTDPRIRVQTLATNAGISAATNQALAMARGEFSLLLDHDDLLRPHALEEFARRLVREPALDAVYSDEDKITADGQRIMPLLKPDFSPEFLLGVMYIGHALCVRTSVAMACGGFDSVYDGIQDYEFFLRLTERTRRIGHIPRILYHWRQSPGSSALHGNIKGDMDQRQVAAVQAHLQRRGDRRTARALGGHRIRLADPAAPTVELLQTSDSELAWAALRQAATTSTADVLVLLSMETRGQARDWLRELAALAALPDSGCVAPLLLSREGRVYESGLGAGQSLMNNFHPGSDGYHGSLPCNREVDAVSLTCVAVRRTLVVETAGAAVADWSGFCAALRAQGRFHRVCASARVQLEVSYHNRPDPVLPPPIAREFYHPYFDPLRSDYTLLRETRDAVARQTPVEFYFDQPTAWDAPLPRCLICRGWCFSPHDSPLLGLRLRIGAMTFAGVVGLPRPDVRAARPDAPDDFTGFEIRATLPAGRHEARFEACLPDGTWKLFLSHPVNVQRQLLPLWLGGGDWMELMFFQMPVHMTHAARPVRPEIFPAARSHPPRPRLTIVTPSYNQVRFLAETMRSVLEQDAAVDYVVQDGGSTDGSKALIERLASEQGARGKGQGNHKSSPAPSSLLPSPGEPAPVSGLRSPVRPRLLQWSSEPDSGQADAIAKGFAKTAGAPEDLMAWINSDDFYLPGTLAYVADYFARHPEVDVLYGHRIVVNEESQEIARWFLPRHDPEVLRLNDFVPQETLFWRRRLWDKVGGIDSAFKFAMDWDLLLRFQAAGARIVRVPYFLACFRVHSAQKTAARMHDLGQKEITLLRERTHARSIPAQELERHPRLLGYLRRSAFVAWLWSWGVRAP